VRDKAEQLLKLLKNSNAKSVKSPFFAAKDFSFAYALA